MKQSPPHRSAGWQHTVSRIGNPQPVEIQDAFTTGDSGRMNSTIRCYLVSMAQIKSMKNYIAFVLVCAAIILSGCRMQTALVDYPQIEKLALASIREKYPDVTPSDLRLDSIRSELASNGAEVIVVNYTQLSSIKREKDSARYGEKTAVKTTTVFVRMSNSGKIQEVGKGSSVSFE